MTELQHQPNAVHTVGAQQINTPGENLIACQSLQGHSDSVSGVTWTPSGSAEAKPSPDGQALLKDTRQQTGKFGWAGTLIGDKANSPFARSSLRQSLHTSCPAGQRQPTHLCVPVDSHLVLTCYNFN